MSGLKHLSSSSGQQFPKKSWLFADFAFQLYVLAATPLTLIVLRLQAWHSFCVVLDEGH
jgi:hypothetical protein